MICASSSPIRCHRSQALGPRARDEEFLALAAACRASPNPIALVGDLNCTPWSPVFRRLLVDGNLRDSRAGFGLQTSWPVGFLPLAIPIDHCLVRGATVRSRRLGPDIRSDHLPMLVALEVQADRAATISSAASR